MGYRGSNNRDKEGGRIWPSVVVGCILFVAFTLYWVWRR
jgi:hypothetical protein